MSMLAFSPAPLPTPKRKWPSFTSKSRCRANNRARVVMTQATTTSLSSWLEANKAKVSPYLDLSAVDERTRQGLRISAQAPAIPQNTELVSLPLSLVLSTETARSTLQSQVDGLHALDLSPESWLALQLVHERKLDSSEFERLLDALPNDLDVASLWTQEQLEWLRGSMIYERAMEIRDAVGEEWERVKKVYDCDEEDYRWAVAMVDSRGIQVGKEIVLGPILTQVGIGEGSARVEVGGGLFSAKSVRLVADKGLVGGDEVCMRYAESRGEGLLERGVGVGVDVVEMVFGLTGMDRFYEDKKDVVDSFGDGIEGERVGDEWTFRLCLKDGWEGLEGMDELLRLVCLGGTDAFLLEGVFRGEIWEHLALPVSEENERAVCDLVVAACEDGLEGYAEGGKGVRGELARGVVDGEKDVLMSVKKSYERRRNSLDAVEYYAERRLKALDLLRPVDESEIVDAEAGGRIGRAFDDNY